ncbi:MAG: c-type cytochrome biogenesis protein CcmI [Roseobacter sp.]
MTFWFIIIGIATAVALLLAAGLRAPRRENTEPAAAYDLRVYRDQLRDVERDLARGVVDPVDADRVRAEISRRILAADDAIQQEAQAGDAPQGSPRVVGIVLAVSLIGGSLWLYSTIGAPGYGDLALQDRISLAEEARANRPTQQQAEDSLPPFLPPSDVNAEYAVLVEKLRETVQNRPDDLQGQTLLAQNEANLGNYRAAARAQGKVLTLKGETADASDFTNYADMLIIAAGGYVSPEAEEMLSQALSRVPGDGTARYYMGLMLAQTGRPDTGFRIWDQLLRAGPADAPWIAPILSQIEELSFRAGVNYQIPEIGTGTRVSPGPDATDLEAVADLSPGERMEMIQGMVQGLSDRLARDGGPAEEWAQLITALGVLGRTNAARSIYDNAVQVFAQDTRALDVLLRAGQQAQVVE